MKIKDKYWRLHTQMFFKRKFAKIGKRSRIIKPIQLDEVSSVILEDGVYISEGAWIMGNSNKSKTLEIGSYTTIGHYFHIVAKQSICIGEKVLIADKVFITDCTHNYKNIEKAIIDDEVMVLGNVKIGTESWIGENVCICGASIGKHCVIGANSVVTSNVPDYSVAVGCPARVIKSYNFDDNKWQNV